MKTLRVGSTGDAVFQWETFLRGQDLLLSKEVDKSFNKETKKATAKFQKINGLEADGIAGNQTFGLAMSKYGFELLTPDIEEEFPPKPNFRPVNYQTRKKLFGVIKYKPSGTKSNPESITITNNWAKDNITRFVVPQLIGVYGAPKSGNIYFHVKVKTQLLNMFQEWEDAGYKKLILSWAGSWAPRFVRGSRSYLSNHSWATAFDINVPWNGLKRTPAEVGKKGSVRELVEIANNNGFYWGGHFKRRDGMHFEVAKLL